MRLQQTQTDQQQTATPATRVVWPDAVAYREAVQTPHISLADPILQTCGIQLDRRGLPVAYAGRFAIVFRLVGENGEVWALRCFTTPGEGGGTTRSTRYRLIQRHVDEHRNIFVPFRYIERGIKVGKQWYPALAMRWASGQPLGRWVETHREDADALRRLGGSLTDLLVRLEAAEIAHGDWQHDNLLVAEDGRRVTLVDYDGMYVPELAGQPCLELGHPNYQHPARTSEHFGVGLDRFACLVIQTALFALAQDPTLWDRYSDGESLLFKREDLMDPGRSPLFQELRALAELSSDETLADAIARLEDACRAGAMSSLLPVVAPGEESMLDDAPAYAPVHFNSAPPERTAATRSAAEAVTARLDSGKVGPWWMVPETVTRAVRQPAQITQTQARPRRQVMTIAPQDTYTFIERAQNEETQKAEERHLLNWRLGAVAMILAAVFIIGVAISIQNPFLPIYFAWLLAYASLGYERWPRKMIYDELVAEIAKMEKLIYDRNRMIAEKGGVVLPGQTGVTSVSEYVVEKLRQTSINRVLTVNGIRASTLRLLRNAGIETALDLQRRTQIDKVPPHQVTALQNWVRELESEAANEYRKTVGATRSAPGEVSRLRHEVAEFERHVTLLKRELELYPDISMNTYWRKLLGQLDPEAPPSSSTP